MFSIIVKTNKNGKYAGFTCDGHAGFEESGKDIVCSALSMLIINTINSIEQFTDQGFKVEASEENGFIDFILTEEPSDKTKLLLDSMLLGIENVRDNYKSYVSIVNKEV